MWRVVGLNARAGGCKLRRAVITVPPHFGDAQRAATGMAATLAGVGRHVTLYEPVNPIIAFARCET